MSRPKGFTLVELLVVIAIIALLMSILMPALARTKKQAMAVLCQSNEKQWTLVFSMYTSDHDGCFSDGYNGGDLVLWTDATRSYYQEPDLRCCPTATKPWTEGGRGTFAAWGRIGKGGSWLTWDGTSKGDYGSYGLNEWLYNPPPEIEEVWDSPTECNWRHINIRNADEVPMLLDCWWLGGGPLHNDEPPEYEGQIVDEGNLNDIKRFCLNRHNMAVNGCFLDLSVRKIPLKCLWKFKWHRKCDTNYPSPVWKSAAPWMAKLPECD